ncbi:phosphatase PAP2 family protein [Microbacterium sulfonylureivorans]|uniref:phosphatase PAP2 family protein n=1 Tax=Microbacterium sulfonylureivorans TaxID=2486854 RepID=UPI000FDAE70B|nr:phosphatase PAP2 family protein [Microbacterium sulfonylureivorans]
MAARTDTVQRTDAAASALRTGRPLALLVWALVLLGAFGLMGLVVSLNAEGPFAQPIDDWWRRLVGAAPDGGSHTWFLPMFFQYLGEAPGALFMVILLPVGLAVVGRWRSALFVFASCLVSLGLYSQGMKNLVDRPRPAADDVLSLFGPLFTVDHGSFPSGHAVAAGALVAIVAALVPGDRRTLRLAWWVVGTLIAVGMMWQRTLINAHWLSDTFFGIVAGVAGVLLMWWAFWPWLQRDYGRPVWFLRFGRRPAADA